MRTVFARVRPVVDFTDDPGLTKQAMKDECDINIILDRYRVSGSLSHVNMNQGSFIDVSEVGDFRSAIDRVESTRSFFSGLSAEIRAGFDNSPAVFLDFLVQATPEELADRGLAGLKDPPVVKAGPPPPEAVVEPPDPPADA